LFEPENDLEISLIRASEDPAHRPQFYRDFVESNIFIIQNNQIPEDEGEVTLEAGMQLEIQNIEIDGKLYIPIFSSVRRIQTLVQNEVGYLALNALEFLKIVNGSELVLNPGSDYGKEFNQSEVASIVDGSIWQPQNSHTVEKETRVLIGQPSNYPYELVESLSRFFRNTKQVHSAYLAHFHNPDTGDPPHTLIGLVVADNWDEIVSSAGLIAEGVEVPDPPIDFLRIDTEEGNLEYFHSIEPFYKRKKFGLF